MQAWHEKRDRRGHRVGNWQAKPMPRASSAQAKRGRLLAADRNIHPRRHTPIPSHMPKSVMQIDRTAIAADCLSGRGSGKTVLSRLGTQTIQPRRLAPQRLTFGAEHLAWSHPNACGLAKQVQEGRRTTIKDFSARIFGAQVPRRDRRGATSRDDEPAAKFRRW